MHQRTRQWPSRLTRAGRTAAFASTVAVVSMSSVVIVQAGAASSHGTEITVVTTSTFGKVLAAGDTVYTLKPSATPCTAKCHKVWPPVVLPRGMSHPVAGQGVLASKLGTRKVHGVGRQLTYKGKLLYWYVRDKAPGQVKGAFTDKWGKWSPVQLSKSSGSGSTAKPSTGSTSGATAGSGGVSF